MFKAFILGLAISLIGLTPTSAVEVPVSFEIRGAGYGHGVGLSQIGARAKALAGESATAILTYYYKDVAIEPLDDTKILRVNIGNLLTSARMASSTPNAEIQIFEGEIGDAQDRIPLVTIPVKSSLNFTILGSTIVPSVTTGKKISSLARSRVFTVRWSGTRYLAGVDAVISLTHSSKTARYRYGQMQVRAVKSPTLGYRIAITNSVRLADEYLWGISEVPSSWPTAALEAQAIASRTYALNKAGIYRTACDCDLYGEISDQKFLGFAKEVEKRWGILWKAAVTNTAGLAITQLGKPISAYFGSSTGGITERAVDAWGGEKNFTQNVQDLASLDPVINPNFYAWNRSITQASVAMAFALPDVVSLEVLGKSVSGTVAMIRATASDGKQVTLRGETFRSRTRIPSAYFDLVSVQNAIEPTPSATP
jgi:SpoIID/LytB domain protein